eukprot:TRINITY_DN4707_c3_g1_i1.p1 TRINITY_DN4707_c3_g1~~TRINITY_DN4707_c3_g1_i1.p1  ORF type:complete len:599 (+),score=177.74 TRINITY_DN4707_c3_g1_i1:65-1798(+)
MVFTVLVSADLYGAKTNFELQFTGLPSFVEFKAKAEAVMATESSLRRPVEVPSLPFTLTKMQVFDDKVDLWVDFVSSSQLREFSQVYIFQLETAYHKEVQSKIPPPCKTIPVLSTISSPSPITSPLPLSPYSETSPYINHAALVAPLAVIPPVLPPAIPAAEATHLDKVRFVFNKMDANRDGLVTSASFVSVLDKLRVEFAPEVSTDLFIKADTNTDSKVSYSEFQRFAEQYPTLLDSLYYRSRDDEESERHAQLMTAAAVQLQAVQSQHLTAREQTADAADRVTAMQAQVDLANEALGQAEAVERDAKALVDSAQAETNTVRATVGQRAQDVAQAKEQTRSKEVRVADIKVEVQGSLIALKNQEAERIKSEQRLADIRELLRQQEEELAVQRENESRAASELAAAEEKQAQAVTELELQREAMQLACEHLSVSKAELNDAQDRQREKGVNHLQAKDGVLKAGHKRDEDERELMRARELETAKRMLEADAEREVSKQEQMCESLAAQSEEQKAKRRATEEEERPLLSEEVRLRSQRDTLEQEEANLRTNHRTFHCNTGRSGAPSASPSRALSHSPTM